MNKKAHEIAKKAAIQAYRSTLTKLAQSPETYKKFDGEGNFVGVEELEQDFGSPYSGFAPAPQHSAFPKAAPVAPKAAPVAPAAHQQSAARPYEKTLADLDPMNAALGDGNFEVLNADDSYAKDKKKDDEDKKCSECGCDCSSKKEASKHSRLLAVAAQFQKALRK